MRVLFDIVHPAHALYFTHPIRMLRQRGDEVLVVSREKDVTTSLLDGLGIEHEPITKAREGLFGQGLELLERDWRLLKIARNFRPDIMVGNGGVAISHVGKFLGIPSLSIYDSDKAPLQLSLAIPFIDEWHVPERWTGPEAKGRTHRFPGCKQYAYLHPEHFTVDDEAAKRAGWDPAQSNFLLRLVAWKANHDYGRKGLDPAQRDALIAALRERGKLHISSESPLPPELEPYRYRGSAEDFHHLLGKCVLCCGESVTVASEATALGVPSLVQVDVEYGYVTEQFDAGVFQRLSRDDDPAAVVDRVLAIPASEMTARMQAYAAKQLDLNQYTLEVIDRMVAGKNAHSTLATA